MKKTLVVFLTVLFSFGLVTSAFVAEVMNNPFKTISKTDWTYQSIVTLAKAGIIDGCSENNFNGDKKMTRYEAAQLVAKALAYEGKTDEAEKIAIEKLTVEFASELNSIGVRFATPKSKANDIKFSGDARLRLWQKNPSLNGTSNGTPDATRSQLRIRFAANKDIDDNWSFSGRFGEQNTTNESDKAPTGYDRGSNNGQVFFDRAEFKYHKEDFTATVGRSTLWLGQGALYDFAFDGVSAAKSFGKLDAKALVGDASLTRSVWSQNISTAVTKLGTGTGWNGTEKFWATDLKYKFNRDAFATATVYDSITSNYPYKNLALGVNATFGDYNFTFENITNSYHVTTASPQKDGYWFNVQWKLADVKKPGTWAANVRYVSMGKDAIDGANTTFAWASNTYGVKGYELGWDYVFAKGAHLNVVLGKYKPYDAKQAGFDSYNTAINVIAFYSF